MRHNQHSTVTPFPYNDSVARTLGFFAATMGVWIAVVLIVQSPDPGLWTVVRWSARVSFVLFMISFAAGGLPQGIRERRGLLFLSFTVSHLFHAAAIVSLALVTRGESLGGRIDVTHFLGMLVYVCILGVAAGYLARKGDEPTGPRLQRLQRLALYLIWIAFAATYVGNIFVEGRLALIPAAVFTLAAMAIRWGQVTES